MKRRSMLATTVAASGALLLFGRGFSSNAASSNTSWSQDQWQEVLPPERFRILFRDATEPAGSSPLNDEHRDGTYVCAACYQPLFESRHKYDSGTGWPSFTQPMDGAVDTRRDFKMIIPRTEYHCSRCGGHQGHVFKDGPPPRHERWCNNGLALRFVVEGEAMPDLRG